MTNPSNLLTARKFLTSISLLLVVLSVAFTTASAQKVEANEAAVLEQCRNGSTPTNPRSGCTDPGGNVGWVTGNAGSANSNWAETEFLAYRMLFRNIPTTGTQTVIIGYDVFHQGVHAIDYLGTFNATETNANPCAGESCTLASPTSTIVVPTETNPALVTPNTGQLPGVFTMWGGNLISATYVEPYAGGDERQIRITFTATVSNPVLAWGGHVAWQGDWGIGNSAGGISGSPYHMRLIELNGQGGNQDRSLSADAVVIPARVTIIKDATGLSGSPTSPVIFDFTASPLFGFPSFGLADNGILGANTQVSVPITLFGTGNEIVVTEAHENTWSLAGITCVNTGLGSFNSVNNIPPGPNGGSVTITVPEASDITCTFLNLRLDTSAAPASIQGRVSTAEGRAISGAYITVANATTGETFRAVSNSFGYYRITDLPVSEFYIMTVNHKRYLFLDASRSFTLDEDMFSADFTASAIE